jgi:hypothetical protein
MKAYFGKSGTQYLCDYCGCVLSGQDKNTMVNKRYIQIKGKISIQDYDPIESKKTYVYVTYMPKDADVPELSFCDPDEKQCFRDYIKSQEAFFKEKRLNELRETAGFDYRTAMP